MHRMTLLAAVSAAALMASGSFAQTTPATTITTTTTSGTAAAAPTPGKVLTGADAFGNWKQDAPGVTRKISVNDLVPPGQTQSASNAPATIPMPAGAVPKVPDGFKIEMVASGLENPRALRFSPNGDLWVGNSTAGQVDVFRFANGSAKPTSHEVFATGLTQPYGVAFYPADKPQWVYVAESNGLRRYPYKDGDMKASGTGEVLFNDIPNDYHWTRDVVFSPDGKTMYYSVGSGSNVSEEVTSEPDGGWQVWADKHAPGAMWGAEERRADVLAFDPDGKNQRIYATGLRNCAGMTLQQQTGQVWCAVNERDELGDNVPFDYATHVENGHFYGWPWYYIGNHEDPRLAGKRPDLADKVTVPDVLFQTHSAPLNIAFENSDALGADYKGDAFVALHGSWNRNTRTGYKVVRLLMDDAGKSTGEYQDFVTGFVQSDTDVWGRPVGVAIAPDGALFFSEDGSGTIWRVSKQ